MTQTEVRSSELCILANLFEGQFTLSYPIYDIELLRVDTDSNGYRVEFPATEADFSSGMGIFGEYGFEMPTYGDFEECLLASGATTYENLDAFLQQGELYHGLKKDVRFGLDTNLLYHRFATVTGAVRPEEVILLDIVKQEIEFALNHKYSGRLIGHLSRAAPDGAGIIAEFENRKKKKSRKAAHLAMAEYRALRDRALLLDTDGHAAHATHENDDLIVRALRHFEEERSELPVLLTADAAMADLCDAEGVEYYLFRAPFRVRPHHLSPWTLFRLITTLSVVFGVISIDSVLVFSEYGGKGNEADAFRLTFIDEDRHTEFARDVEVCRKLLALGIER
ncbi:PIN domain-containing protein [Methanofollis fontis]|uniref:PIN domain-containing protein n=1 Tax=Methanofollis fontis TaxID=2052832 RepID=A0A483CN13_9EURY|nr:PIN domain-containing protein [Methanofollis fontis]TAJ44012.1 hypothetical protein CUJ86_08180 [Methanofollis fontis]